MLETWDEQLAALGEEIVMDRCEFIDGLSTIAYDLHKSITGGRERLEIVYEPDIDPEDPEGIYGAMLKALDRSRAEDLRRGFTTARPPPGRYRHSPVRHRRAHLRLPGPETHRSAVT